VIHLLSRAKAFGFKFDNLAVDYGEAHKRSRNVVSRQTKRISILMKNHGIAVHEGVGRLTSALDVVIEPSGETLKAKHIILATGARPRPCPESPLTGRG